MTVTTVNIIPRDGFVVKDGRGWHTSGNGRGHSLDWPWPSTLLGALRTAWGRAEEARIGKGFSPSDWVQQTTNIHLGRTLAMRQIRGTASGPHSLVWPTPVDTLWLAEQKDVFRLDPVRSVAPTLGRDDDSARELLWWPRSSGASKPLPRPKWLNHADFVKWLAGSPVAATLDIPAPERRVQIHVGIDPDTLTFAEGVVFSHDVVETVDRSGEWSILAEVSWPGDADTVATLGSDSRLALLRPPQSTDFFDPPTDVLDVFGTSSGLRVVAVSPLCFKRGWLPDGFEAQDNEYRGQLPGMDHELVLRAAFVQRPVHASGWDIVGGHPKPTSRLVPPGSVYFFERADEQPVTQSNATALWLAAVGQRTNEGYGRIVPGIWNPIRSKS